MSGRTTRPIALSIAGFDPTGGAGVLADCLTFERHGVEGVAAIAAMTVQDGVRVHRVDAVDPALLEQTLQSLFARSPIGAAKTGLLPNAEIVQLVAQCLPAGLPLIVDPVLASSGGFPFLDEAGRHAMIELLFPKAALVTPNLSEAVALTGEKDPARAGVRMLAMGARAALIKGGHAQGPEAIDLLFEKSGLSELRLPRHERLSMHGSGCALSAGIAAGMAKGLSLREAAWLAKQDVHHRMAEGKTDHPIR